MSGYKKAIDMLNQVKNYDGFTNLIVENEDNLPCIEVEGYKFYIKNLLRDASHNKKLKTIKLVSCRYYTGLVFSDDTSCIIDDRTNEIIKTIFLDGGEEYESKFCII